MRDREISVSDLNKLRLWVEARPEVPEGDWYKDFGSFKSAEEDRTQKRSYSEGKSPRAKPSDHHALGDYSREVAQRLHGRNMRDRFIWKTRWLAKPQASAMRRDGVN